MIVPVQDQDKGLAHCHYIRQLANEIWLKENARPSGIKLKFEDCIRRALLLHRRKLMNNKIDKILAEKRFTPVSDPRMTRMMAPGRWDG